MRSTTLATCLRMAFALRCTVSKTEPCPFPSLGLIKSTVGMGVLLATVWVNLAQNSSRVVSQTRSQTLVHCLMITQNDRLSVHFFSVAFLGFMSVAGIPAFLEERLVFTRERMNGLYGPGAYVIANTIVTVPYLFVCALLFAVISYWSIGLNPGADQFFKFLGILFLAVFTAEAQSTVVAAFLPIFVAALAIASFMNGFWMVHFECT